MGCKRLLAGALLAGVVLLGLWLAPNTTTAAGPVDWEHAIGPLKWTQFSVCEWPLGHHLNYYTGDGDDLWFAGDLVPSDDRWRGATILATGHLRVNGSCTILEVTAADVRLPPSVDANLDNRHK